MGGFSSGSNPLIQAGAGMADSMIGGPWASLAVKVLDGKTQLDQQRNYAQAAYERQTQALRQQQEYQTRQKQNLLNRSQASARAMLASMGVAGNGGSGDALMQGLQQQTNEELGYMNNGFANQQSMLDWGWQQKSDSLDQAERNFALGSGLDAWGKIKKAMEPKDQEQQNWGLHTLPTSLL